MLHNEQDQERTGEKSGEARLHGVEAGFDLIRFSGDKVRSVYIAVGR